MRRIPYRIVHSSPAAALVAMLYIKKWHVTLTVYCLRITLAFVMLQKRLVY